MMTIQEMFNKAYIGIRSQGFSRCYVEGKCVYSSNGKHCAWGWVDTNIPDGAYPSSNVKDLYYMKKGVAAHLSFDELGFAYELQHTHDVSYTEYSMEMNLRGLATHYGLTIPE